MKKLYLTAFLLLTTFLKAPLGHASDSSSSSFDSEETVKPHLSAFESLSDDVVREIIGRLSISDRKNVAQANKNLNKLCNDETRVSYSKKISAFFAGTPFDFFRDPVVDALTGEQGPSYFRVVDAFFSVAREGIFYDVVDSITKKCPDPLRAFVILAYSSDLFTQSMSLGDRTHITQALDPLSKEQIGPFARTLKTHHDVFFTEDMTGNDRAMIISALTPLSEKQIGDFANALKTHHQTFFKDMEGFNQSFAIYMLSSLTIEQINALSGIIVREKFEDVLNAIAIFLKVNNL